MAWEIEFTDEFGAWWQTLTEVQQDDMAQFFFWAATKGAMIAGMKSSFPWQIGFTTNTWMS